MQIQLQYLVSKLLTNMLLIKPLPDRCNLAMGHFHSLPVVFRPRLIQPWKYRYQRTYNPPWQSRPKELGIVQITRKGGATTVETFGDSVADYFAERLVFGVSVNDA